MATSIIERTLLYHEPVASTLLKYLAVHDVVLLASTCHELRLFLYSHTGYWRNTDLGVCSPGETSKDLFAWAGPSELLNHWDNVLKNVTVPYNTPGDPERVTMFLNTLFWRNLPECVNVTRLVLDGLPVGREMVLRLSAHFRTCLRELSVRWCKELKLRDFVDLLDFPEPGDSGANRCPENLQKLGVYGTEVYTASQEWTQTSRVEDDLLLGHLRSLIAARAIQCDIAICGDCPNRWGLRGRDACRWCGEVDHAARCPKCEGVARARWACASCRRYACLKCRPKVTALKMPDQEFYCKECIGAVESLPSCVRCERRTYPITSFGALSTFKGSIDDICVLCEQWMCKACQAETLPDMDWIARECGNCFSFMCIDCKEKYTGEDGKEPLGKGAATEEVITLRQIYQDLINQDPPPLSPHATAVTRRYTFSPDSEALAGVGPDGSTKIGPSAIRNLLEKRAGSWKPLLGYCIECEEWWCWECRLRCTCGKTTEALGDDKEASDCGSMDEGPSEQDAISDDGESNENSAPQLSQPCFIHNAVAKYQPNLVAQSCWSCDLWRVRYEPLPAEDGSEEFDPMDSSDEWEWFSHRSDSSDSG